VTRDSETSETIIDLFDRIKFIHLSSHHSRLIRDVTAWQTSEVRAKYTLSGASPKFCEERYHGYAGLISDPSFTENSLSTRRGNDSSIRYHLMITLYKGYIGDSFREFMNGIMAITELLKVSFCQNFLVFYNCENYFIYDVRTMLRHRNGGY
jgi:hypothetical protein